MTQEERIMDYLDKHPSGITQLEAYKELGVWRLASRISDLRKDGVKIVSERVQVTNRFGETCYISNYKLYEE